LLLWQKIREYYQASDKVLFANLPIPRQEFVTYFGIWNLS
jgi:hypothetical protein